MNDVCKCFQRGAAVVKEGNKIILSSDEVFIISVESLLREANGSLIDFKRLIL
jgi:hypothetical protein